MLPANVLVVMIFNTAVTGPLVFVALVGSLKLATIPEPASDLIVWLERPRSICRCR